MQNERNALRAVNTCGLLESQHEAKFGKAQTTKVFRAFNRIALARRPKYTTWKACLHFILNPTVSVSTLRYEFYIFHEIYFLMKPNQISVCPFYPRSLYEMPFNLSLAIASGKSTLSILLAHI